MKGGKVVRCRLSPRDCMSVVDVAAAVGVDTSGRVSFDNVVRLALSALLQTAREHQIIPEREGFEYSAMMQPFSGLSAHAEKLAFTKMTDRNMMQELHTEPALQVQARPTLTAEQRRAKIKYDELCVKREHAPESVTPEDEAEWTRVLAVLAGD